MAVLSLAALALPCTMARSENRAEAKAAIMNEWSRLGAEKEEVDRKLAAVSDAAEREALLASSGASSRSSAGSTSGRRTFAERQ